VVLTGNSNSRESLVVSSRESRVTLVTGQLTDGSRVKKCDPLSSLQRRSLVQCLVDERTQSALYRWHSEGWDVVLRCGLV